VQPFLVGKDNRQEETKKNSLRRIPRKVSEESGLLSDVGGLIKID